MDVSDQVHTPAALTLRKPPCIPSVGSCLSEGFGEEKNMLSLQGFEPQILHPRSVVTIPTELSRLKNIYIMSNFKHTDLTVSTVYCTYILIRSNREYTGSSTAQVMDYSPKCYLLPCVYAPFGDPIALPLVPGECLTNCWITPMRCWTIVHVLKNIWYIQRFEICSTPVFESRHTTEQVGVAVTLQTSILKVHRISSMTVGVLINFLPVNFGVKTIRASFEILD